MLALQTLSFCMFLVIVAGTEKPKDCFANLSTFETQRLDEINRKINDWQDLVYEAAHERRNSLPSRNTQRMNGGLKFLILPASLTLTGDLQQFQLEFASERSNDLMIGKNFPYQQIGEDAVWSDNAVLRIQDQLKMKSSSLLYQLHTTRLLLSAQTPLQLMAWLRATMQCIATKEKPFDDILGAIKHRMHISNSTNMTKAGKSVLFLIRNGWQQDRVTKRYVVSNVIDAMLPKLQDPDARIALVYFFEIVINEIVSTIIYECYCLVGRLKHARTVKQNVLKMSIERIRIRLHKAVKEMLPCLRLLMRNEGRSTLWEPLAVFNLAMDDIRCLFQQLSMMDIIYKWIYVDGLRHKCIAIISYENRLSNIINLLTQNFRYNASDIEVYSVRKKGTYVDSTTSYELVPYELQIVDI